jgi:signal transduction histidine kinase
MYSLIESDHDLYEPGLAAIEALVFEEDRELFRDQVSRKFEICEPFDTDFRIVTPTGQIKFCNMKGRPHSPDQPVARGMMGTLSDITSRKSKEAEIVILNDRLHILVDALGRLSETRTLNALGSLIKNYAGQLVNSGDVKFIFREGDYFILPGEEEEAQGLKQKISIGTDIISRVIVEAERLVIADLRDIVHPEYFSLVDPSARSILVIPVSSESTTGAIMVCRPKPFLPSGMEIRVLESLSYAASIAIENIRFYTELEAMVNERTEQLSAVNKELESFTYSVSHDLRAPLRSIEGFVRILEEDYSLKLGPEGLRVCSIIEGSSRKMRNLIDNLLEFAKLGKQEIRKVQVDMKALAETVISELTSGSEQKNLDISIEKLPEAFGDPYMLHQVWTNYLSNAMKFSSGKGLQKIAVSGRQEEDRITYEVTDNGAGFDMEYSGKLFGVFQRLHSASEFEGTGVGLAIVQRIIHRHGGAVWAEGRTGEGARFSFSLPLEQ